MTLIISVNLGSSFCPKQHMHQKRLKHKHRCCLLSSLYWLHYWFGCLQLQDLTNNAAEYARLWLRREKESARQGKILSEHLMRMSHLRSVWPSIFWWVSKVYLPILPMNFFFLVFGRIHTHISLRLNCLYTDTNNSPPPRVSCIFILHSHERRWILYTDRRRLEKLLNVEVMMPPSQDPERFSFWVCFKTCLRYCTV